MNEPVTPAPPSAHPDAPMPGTRHPLVLAALVLALLVVIGAFLPWASVLDIVDKNGIEGDGVLTLILAIIGAGALLLGRGRLWGLITMLIAASLIALIGFVDLADVGRVADQLGVVETGAGLWLTALAGVAWTGLSITLLAVRSRIWGPRGAPV